MGVEYGAFNHLTKTWVELGKGAWYDLDPQLGLWDNAERILDNYSGFKDTAQEQYDWALYCVWVVGRFCGFTRTGKWEPGTPMEGPVQPGSVEILCDGQDEYQELSQGSGSYRKPGPEAYQKVGERYWYCDAEIYIPEIKLMLGDALDELLALCEVSKP